MFKITPLSGSNSEESIVIKEGFTIGGPEADLILHKTNSEKELLKITSNSQGHLIITAEKGSLGFEVGGEQLFDAVLFPGMMITIANKQFIIEEFDQSENTNFSSEQVFTVLDVLSEMAESSPKEIKSTTLLPKPVQFHFVRGNLLNTTWKILHCPILFGSTSDSLFFLDTSLETAENFLTLSLSSKNQFELSTTSSQSVSINKTPLRSQNVVSDGDLVEFADTAFYIYL